LPFSRIGLIFHTGSGPNLKLKEPKEPDLFLNRIIQWMPRSYCKRFCHYNLQPLLRIFNGIQVLQLFIAKHQSLIYRLIYRKLCIATYRLQKENVLFFSIVKIFIKHPISSGIFALIISLSRNIIASAT